VTVKCGFLRSSKGRVGKSQCVGRVAVEDEEHDVIALRNLGCAVFERATLKNFSRWHSLGKSRIDRQDIDALFDGDWHQQARVSIMICFRERDCLVADGRMDLYGTVDLGLRWGIS
jgi:hypothetical protein